MFNRIGFWIKANCLEKKLSYWQEEQQICLSHLGFSIKALNYHEYSEYSTGKQVDKQLSPA